MLSSWLSAFLVFTLCLFARADVLEQFDEELSIKPLQDGRIVSTFAFKTLLKGASPRDPRTLGSDDESQHYSLFPLALGQILREYGVSELHLTLNSGNWDYDRWGYPLEKGVGTGAELWTWMGEGAPMSIDARWKGLRNALAGLFCASLGSLNEQRTTSPWNSFNPEGDLPDWGLTHHIRHASLPSEHICTENLTPFLKLLPCKSLSGIASLLNPHRLFDADWHGMGIHVLWNQATGVEVRLSFQSVSNPQRLSSGRNKDWSLSTSFDRKIERVCPVATSSQISITLPENSSYEIVPDVYELHGKTAAFDLLTAIKPFDVTLLWNPNSQYVVANELLLAPLSIQRTLRGTNQAHGRLSIILRNRKPISQSLLYLETMPWLIQFSLHTMEARIEGRLVDGIISNVTYIPAVPHSRPTMFQSIFTLPPQSTVHITMEVTKAFLRYTEHPPDAQRGWDLPPAVITLLNQDKEEPSGDRIYTSTLLVDLATPDFSMPYNVIIFSCSLMAFIFGSIFNLLTRKFVIVHIEPDKIK